MRIVIDGRVTSRHYPGIGRYCLHLIGALLDLPTDHRWMILYDPRHNPDLATWATVKKDRAAFIAVPLGVRSLAEQVAVPTLVRQLQPDVIHLPYYAIPLGFVLPWSAAVIVTLYDLIPQLFPDYWPNPAMLTIINGWSKLAYRRASAILTLSEASRHDLASIYDRAAEPRQRVMVTPCGADERFLAQASARQENGPWPLDLHRPYFLYVGSNKPHKNLPALVEAYALHRNSRQAESDLVIAGRWDERYPQAKEAVARLEMGEHVHFRHEVSDTDLAALYRGARAFVFPSQYEGFGFPVLEAMAAAVPVLTSESSSLPEVGGDAVLYCQPQDIAGIAAELGRLDSDATLRQRLAQAGHERAKSFTWAQTAETSLAYYQETIA